MSIALVFASLVMVLTIVKNPSYALAESKATAADGTQERGDLRQAMNQIDDTIALAPDVGRYNVQRSKILDQVRTLSDSQSNRVLLAHEAYAANQRAVATNPFDIYSRLHFAESTLMEARLGQEGKGDEAIEESKRVTSMLRRF